jgi:hypothetical protein
MENVKITEEQAKTLKLFAYYAQSYGKKEVNTSIYTESCQEDWRDHEWYGDGSAQVESYDAIDSVIDEIIEEHDLFAESVTDCDNRGQLHINIDCVERTLKIDASEWRYDTNSSGDVLEMSDLEEEHEDLVKIFNYMKSEGYSEGVVTFAGGGDSGEIESRIEYDNKFTEQISKGVEGFFYEWLEKHFGGWEINEGSQGRFVFNADDDNLELEFEENTEEDYGLGQVFYTKF